MTSLLVHSPITAASWATTLCQCFAFQRSSAALLLHQTSQAGPHALLPHRFPTPSSRTASLAAAQAASLQQSADGTCTADQQPTSTGSAAASTLNQTSSCQHNSAPLQDRQDASQSSTGRAHSATAEPEATDEASSADVVTVLLPRMPMGLSHITAPACYAAVANVARTMAKAAHKADQANVTSSGEPAGDRAYCRCVQ